VNLLGVAMAERASATEELAAARDEYRGAVRRYDEIDLRLELPGFEAALLRATERCVAALRRMTAARLAVRHATRVDAWNRRHRPQAAAEWDCP